MLEKLLILLEQFCRKNSNEAVPIISGSLFHHINDSLPGFHLKLLKGFFLHTNLHLATQAFHIGSGQCQFSRRCDPFKLKEDANGSDC